VGAATSILEDEGNNPQILAWILDACSLVHGHLDPAEVIGKPRALFGLEGHLAAIAHGLAIVVERVAADRHLHRPRVAIQDLGEYGHLLAHCCDKRSMQIVAMADSSGGIYSPSGIGISSLTEWLDEHGMLIGYPDAEAVCNTEVVTCNCDLLIAAAPRNPIGVTVADKVRATIVVEGVHGGITAAAVELLESRGSTVVPYVLAGAGGMAHACLEWMVNTSGHVLLAGEAEAEEHLDRRMQVAYTAAHEASLRYGIGLHDGAYVAGIGLIADALRLH
jgi:glutamate dehydrogenase/leucine dehydrogenase